MAFFYGAGLPLLFPVCIVGILILYMVDIIKMAYFYQQPPLYDGELSIMTINLLKYTPACMMFMGFWMLTSDNLFKNNNILIDNYFAKHPEHSHDFFRLSTESIHVAPMLVMFFIAFFI